MAYVAQHQHVKASTLCQQKPPTSVPHPQYLPGIRCPTCRDSGKEVPATIWTQVKCSAGLALMANGQSGGIATYDGRRIDCDVQRNGENYNDKAKRAAQDV
ncbi:hypothetical protein HYQ44_003836 [Verticillium longisporum]|nr:hypothetical protein HYQ44_003836 [Verticillium longisporum]